MKRSIAKAENIEDLKKTSLFLSPFSQSPLDDAVKVTIHNLTDPGSTPEKPLAFVATMSDSERRRGGLAMAASTESDDVRYGKSIQHSESPNFLFVLTSFCVGGSILYALLRRR